MADVLEIFWGICKILFCYLEALYKLIVPPARKSVAGKVVLVTGAGRGIGKELALQFAELDAKLALWDINKNEVEETAREIKSKGGSAYSYGCDVSSYDDVKQAAAKVREDLQTVDIVVNNAGVMCLKDVLSLTEKDIKRTININTVAHFWIIKEFLPAMIDRNEGHIVTISSMAGKGGSHFLTDYCASKCAAFGLNEALSEELRVVFKKSGVQTSVVCPMFVNTALVQEHLHRVNVVGGFMADVMTPAYVASQIIDGVLRNRAEIYIPSTQSSADLIRAIMPRKAMHILRDLGVIGCYKSKTKTD